MIDQRNAINARRTRALTKDIQIAFAVNFSLYDSVRYKIARLVWARIALHPVEVALGVEGGGEHRGCEEQQEW